MYEYKSVWVGGEGLYAPRHSKGVSNGHEQKPKKDRKSIKIIHNNVPGLDITYVEGCEGEKPRSRRLEISGPRENGA